MLMLDKIQFATCMVMASKMELLSRVHILAEAVSIFFLTNALGKDTN